MKLSPAGAVDGEQDRRKCNGLDESVERFACQAQHAECVEICASDLRLPSVLDTDQLLRTHIVNYQVHDLHREYFEDAS